jgi:Hg(II)-responsive transcriptional regulator
MNAQKSEPATLSHDGLDVGLSTNLTIGRVAKAAQVGVETIRYYQRLGLLPTPVPSRNAFRHYSYEVVERIRFIKRAQDLGFSLEDIAALLQLNDGADRTRVRELAGMRLQHIREKIADLGRMESILSSLLFECEHAGHATSCPIIAAFSGTKETKPGDPS